MTGSVIDRGNGKWLLKWDLPRLADGKRRQAYKVVQVEGKKEAKAALRAELAKVDSGQYVAPSKLLFSECIEAWLAQERVDRGAKTLERYEDLIRKHVRPRLGHLPVQSITDATLNGIYGDLRAEPVGLAPRTINHIHRVIFAILRRAVKDKRVTQNVAEAAEPPSVPDDEIEVLDDKQTATVLEALRGKALYPLVLVSVSTGIRRGELCALRWNDLDFERAKLRVDESLEQTKALGLRVKPPKTRSGRRILSLPALVVTELRSFWKATAETRLKLGMGTVPADAFVFGHIDTGAPRSPNALTREWSRALAKIKGVPAVTWHALRHTHASQMLAAGVDIVTVSKRLGHAKPDITLRVYSHLMPGADAAAAAAVEKALNASLGTR